MSGFTFASRVQHPLPSLLPVVFVAVVGAWLLLVTPARAEVVTITVCPEVGECQQTTILNALGEVVARAALDDDHSEEYVIEIRAGIYNEANLTIDVPVRVVGADRDTVIIDGSGTSGPVFRVEANRAATIENVTIREGHSSTFGGAVHSEGSLVVENVSFEGNEAERDGGAIYQSGGSLSVTDAEFSGNTAENMGGAIYHSGSSLQIARTTFDGNSALSGSGEAVYSTTTGTISGSLFLTTTDTVAMRGGTVASSSFPTWDEEIVTTYDAQPITATGNWWGGTTPSGAHGVTAVPYLTSVTVAAAPTSQTVNAQVTATATVIDSAGAPSTLPVKFSVAGAGLTSVEADGTYSFTSGTAGADTVTARVVFGDGSAADSDLLLLGSAAVTWTAPAPPPPPEDDPIDLLTPWMDLLSEQEKADVLTETGLFPPGVIDPNDLTRAQITSTPNDILRFEDASRISLGLPQSTFDPVGWWANSIPAAIASGLAGGDPFNISPLSGLMTFDFLEDVFVSYFEQFFANLEAALNGLFPASVNSEFPGMLGWGFLFDDAGAIADSILGAASIEDASVEEDPTLVSLEIAEGSLPADVRVEQITLARLDTEVGRWIPVESVVVPLEDGGFGLLAWLDQTGVFGVMMRPVAERALHEGVTALVWFGAEGQPPSRAILGADAEIEALWVLDAGTWRSYRPGAPAFTQTLSALKNGQPIMVVSPGGGSWLLPTE